VHYRPDVLDWNVNMLGWSHAHRRRVVSVRRALCVACVLGMTACGPVGVKLPVVPPATPATWEGLPASAPAAPDMTGWWKAFGDPALDALVARALSENLDIQAMTERLEAARSLDHHARDPYLPALRAKTEDLTEPDASASFFAAGFDATWELGLFGRATGTKRAAQGTLMTRQADVRAARVTVIAEVVRDWVELRAAQNRVALLGDMRDAASRRMALVGKRADLHLASPADVAQARAEVDRAAQAMLDPANAADIAARRLAALLGRLAPDPSWNAPGEVPRLGAWKLDEAPAELLRTRPEIAALEGDVTRMAGELGLARADMYPNIGLGASMIWSTEVISYHRTRNTTGIASLGPILDIPLFDWGMRQSIAHAKKHEFRATLLNYRQSVLQGVAEVQSALDTLGREAERERLGEALLQSATTDDAAVSRRAALALASQIDVARSRAAVDNAKVAVIDARTSRALAYVALFKAVGGAPLGPDGTPDAQAAR
jgi:NodT family efflux transporter outer membrane factor (OMF) lipoprotein